MYTKFHCSTNWKNDFKPCSYLYSGTSFISSTLRGPVSPLS